VTKMFILILNTIQVGSPTKKKNYVGNNTILQKSKKKIFCAKL
jgi:hypothetical protein